MIWTTSCLWSSVEAQEAACLWDMEETQVVDQEEDQVVDQEEDQVEVPEEAQEEDQVEVLVEDPEATCPWDTGTERCPWDLDSGEEECPWVMVEVVVPEEEVEPEEAAACRWDMVEAACRWAWAMEAEEVCQCLWVTTPNKRWIR